MAGSPVLQSHATWSNWDGRQSCSPATVVRPADEQRLAEAVGIAAESGQSVRAVGSGHSFTAACVTDGCQISLLHMDQIVDADRSSGLVKVQAGIPLHRLTRALASYGLALENQGDIDVQTLSGATATATHGTGEKFRNLSSGIVGCRIALADGSVRE